MAEGIPLIVQKSQVKQKAEAKNKNVQNKDQKSEKSGKTTFEKIIDNAGKDDKSAEKKEDVKLLKFISRVVKKIQDGLPSRLKDTLLAFVKKIIQQSKFSEKEKGDILTLLLKKLKQKDGFSSFISDISKKAAALNFALDAEVNNVSEKNALLAKIKKTMENISAEKEKNRNIDGLSKLVVIDLRKEKIKNNQVHAKTVHAENTGINDKGENIRNHLKSEGTQDSMQYFSLKDGENSLKQEAAPGITNKETSVFDQEMLKRLKDSLKNEVVKQTKIILKENGKGEIRIVLKPESLGRVRMRVQLQNNHIDGRIFVENNNIKEIFESTLNNLNSALKQEGFDSVSLRVSVGNGDQQEQREKPPEYTYSEAADEFEKNAELLFDPGVDYSRVNLFI